MNFNSKVVQTVYNEKQMLLSVSCLFLRKNKGESYPAEERSELPELRCHGTGALLSRMRTREY
jgi:hypothetical protein